MLIGRVRPPGERGSRSFDEWRQWSSAKSAFVATRSSSVEHKDRLASGSKLRRTREAAPILESRHFGITPVTFGLVPRRSTMPMDCAFRGGNSRMGERVTQSGRPDLSRANRLKKALGERSPPAFVQPENQAAGKCRRRKIPLLPLTARARNIPALCLRSLNPRPERRRPPLQFLEQMFQASPDGLSIADCDHRVLWANETFVRMFDYEAAEVVGQSLENLVVPPDASGRVAMGDRGARQRRAHHPGNPAQKKRWNPARCFLVVRASAAEWEDGGLLCRLSRHFRPQARRGAEFRALPRRREEQQRPRTAAVLRRRAQHCR